MIIFGISFRSTKKCWAKHALSSLPQEGDVASFTCDKCGHCCRSHRVPLTRSDLKKLAFGITHLGLGELSWRVELVGPTEVDMVGEPESLALLREGWRLLVLRHEPPTPQSSEASGGCTFLSKEGSCSLHHFRPSSCRAYPFDRPDPGRDSKLGLHPELLCPPETLVQLTLNADPRANPVSRQYQLWISERDDAAHKHAEWIARWNRQQRTRLRLGRLAQGRDEFLHCFLDTARTNDG